MDIAEFRLMQKREAVSKMTGLVRSAQYKFICAANLLELRNPVIDRVRHFAANERFSIWPLLEPYEVISERYAQNIFSSQRLLFPTPNSSADEKWWHYFHHRLTPHLLEDDNVVRNVLRSVYALPCVSPSAAAKALTQHFTEMTLPETKPIWAAENNP